MTSSPISVLIVEDSPVALTILKRILTSTPEIEISGIARDGIEALELIPKVKPKVICTDLYMPRMSGLELIQRVMAECPRPILVISAAVDQTENRDNVFQLLQAGALDVFLKPSISLMAEYEKMKQDLITRIRILAGVSVFTIHPTRDTSFTLPPNPSPLPLSFSQSPRYQAVNPKIVAIGASTGGPQALYTILKELPANFPLPILCVQHISEGFLSGLTSWLSSNCQLRVAIAKSGDLPQPGTVYFAPDHCHLRLNSQGRFVTSGDTPVCGHCPSATVLLQSTATVYKQAVLGILLTGMGRDGAEGLLAIAKAGGSTIAQDEQSSVVFGMPKAAIDLGAAQQVLPLTVIASTLLKLGVQVHL